MLRTACSLVFVCALAATAPAAAQDQPVAPQEQQAAAIDQSLAPCPAHPASRPAALVPLYASFAALQALDYASTTRALARGAGREANPMMQSIVGNRAAFIAVKAGATAGVIVAGEKIWKKNRVAAVIFVAAMNGAVSAIVARNYSVR